MPPLNDAAKENLKILKVFLEDLKADKAPGTIAEYRYILTNAMYIVQKPFNDWLKTDITVTLLPESERRFNEKRRFRFEEMQKGGLINSSVQFIHKPFSEDWKQLIVIALHVFFTFLEEMKYIISIPITFNKFHFKIDKDFKRTKRLTKNGILEFISTVKSEKLRVMLFCMYGQTLRISEAIRLQIQDVNFENNTLHVFSVKTTQHRTIPLDADVRDSLFDYILEYFFQVDVKKIHRVYTKISKKKLRDEDRILFDLIYNHDVQIFLSDKFSLSKFNDRVLFPNRSGKPYKNTRTIHAQIMNANEEFKVYLKYNLKRRITSHFMRGNGATEWNANGMPIEVLRVFMGHKSLETTKGYAQQDEEKLIKFVKSSSFLAK